MGKQSTAILGSCLVALLEKDNNVRDIQNKTFPYLEKQIAAAASAAHGRADNAQQQQAYHPNDRYASGRGQ